jgi:hypothetical protein
MWDACTESKCCEEGKCCGHHGGKFYAGCQPKCWWSQTEITAGQGDRYGPIKGKQNKSAQIPTKRPAPKPTQPDSQGKPGQSDSQTKPAPTPTQPGTPGQPDREKIPAPTPTQPDIQEKPGQSDSQEEPGGIDTTDTNTDTDTAGQPDSQEKPGGGEGFKEWTGSGITFHGQEYDKSTVCTKGTVTRDADNGNDNGALHGCSNSGKDPAFIKSLKAFCQKSDIAFGHPLDKGCGECIQVRVKKSGGGYNGPITVFTMDNPNDGRSPEVSTAAYEKLLPGTDCGNGRVCGKGDRLKFEYKDVPC